MDRLSIFGWREGISAEDALIADLNVDSAFGWQSFEATYFLIYKHVVDTAGSVILWQIGMIGVQDYSASLDAWNPAGVKLLQSALQKIYPPRHNGISRPPKRLYSKNFTAA